MSENCKCKRAITVAFEEAALALGGVAATYPIPDEAVWDLARSLDLIHQRACGKCGAANAVQDEEPEDAEHPAIVHLLAQLNGGHPMDRGPRR
jgi:hypothetical protein